MTKEDISVLFEEKKAALMEALVKDFIAVFHSEELEQHTAPCPQCGKLCPSKWQASRRIDSRQGRACLNGPTFTAVTAGWAFLHSTTPYSFQSDANSMTCNA